MPNYLQNTYCWDFY